MMTKTRIRTWTRRRFSKHLIEESDLAYCLHFAFQNHHIEPGIFMGFRTHNDPIPDGERAFMLASIKKAISEGDTPVKVRNFSSDKKKGGTE